MEKVAIVVLNYLNYEDTIECIASIKKMEYDLAGIVIVDNGSTNESYDILKRRYNREKNISVLRAGKNYGFAKGNNIGIKVARERYRADFVYIVNNDVIFQDPDFFKKLLQEYDENTGIIGSKIVLNNNIVQPRYYSYVTFPEVLNRYIRFWLIDKNKEIWIQGLPVIREDRKKAILHGCGLLFTPVYFKKYIGFYPRTFLYTEEEILYLICERYQIKQKYTESTYIFHKEDQSSILSFQNNSDIKQKYVFMSYKYVVWWALKNEILNRIKKRE